MFYAYTAWASALLLVLWQVGNAKASKSGTSNRDKTPALFLSICSQIHRISFARQLGVLMAQ